MTVEEIRLRRLANQHLLLPTDKLTVVQSLCGIQAQFFSNAVHAMKIRCRELDGETFSDGLVKSWTIRGTMHIFAESDLPLFLHSGRQRTLRPCDTMEADDCITAARKRMFADLIVCRIAAGVDEREALKRECFAAGMTEREAESVFNAWGGTIRALCEDGVICHRVQEKKAFQLTPAFTPMPVQDAWHELLRRYFTNFGPATVRDAAYFFGTSQAQIRKGLEELPVTPVECGEKIYFYVENGKDFGSDIPACIFLAGFDPLMLGYQKTESLFLPQAHLRGIFSLAGIVMPPVLLNGRVAGRWKKKGETLTITQFEKLSVHAQKEIWREAGRLWGGSIKIKFENGMSAGMP